MYFINNLPVSKLNQFEIFKQNFVKYILGIFFFHKRSKIILRGQVFNNLSLMLGIQEAEMVGCRFKLANNEEEH